MMDSWRYSKLKMQFLDPRKLLKYLCFSLNFSSTQLVNSKRNRPKIQTIFTCCFVCLPDGTKDLWVPAHSQIVVAAPHWDLRGLSSRKGVILGMGELLGAPVYGLKHSVSVVLLFLFNHFLEEAIIIITGSNWFVGHIDMKLAIRNNVFLRYDGNLSC